MGFFRPVLGFVLQRLSIEKRLDARLEEKGSRPANDGSAGTGGVEVPVDSQL